MQLNINDITNWEEHFLQEALELEMKMKEMTLDTLSKTKLRIALEQQILSWDKFSQWYTQTLGCCSLKISIDDTGIEKFIENAKVLLSKYENLGIWTEDLLPLLEWNGVTYVVGLQYSEKLVEINNLVFILAPPQILSYLHFKITGATFNFEKAEVLNSENESASESESVSMFDQPSGLIDLSSYQSNPSSEESQNLVSFKEDSINTHEADSIAILDESQPLDTNPLAPVSLSMFNDKTNNNETKNNTKDSNSVVWDFLSERHNEYNFEVKKSFDAFVVLKINNGKTQVFKFDSDLEENGVSTLIFEFDINKSIPLKAVQQTGRSTTYTLKELDLNIIGFSHACVTPLKRGRSTLGFFIGLNKSEVASNHQQFLTELANEAANS